MLDSNLIKRLKERAHIHTEKCYGAPEMLCVEHHMHTQQCMTTRLICYKKEDKDLYNFMQYLERTEILKEIS